MLRFVSGVLAWVRARAVTAGEKDTGLVDWLESRRGDSPVVLRWSNTGRGWRLHDWSGGIPSQTSPFWRCRSGAQLDENVPIGIIGGPAGTVRDAIREAMLSAAWDGGSAHDGLASKITDSQMLDWLDCLSGRYTGRVIWRRSTTGSGWRLHETSRRDAAPSVREAVSDAIRLGR